MNGYLVQPFLTEYYLLEAVCGKFMSTEEKKQMFEALAQVFCITDRNCLDEYYTESCKEHFSEITDFAAYERFCRTVEFAEKSGQTVCFSDTDRVILAQKRIAMAIKNEIFGKVKNLTKETVAQTLTLTARGGSIEAMNMLSYMEYHGIFVCRDEHHAIKRIRLSSKWNSFFGGLMGLCYDAEKRGEHLDRVFTASNTADKRQTFEHIRAVYGGAECQKDATARILEKAFERGVVKRGVYDRTFASVVFSELISSDDKEKLLLNKQRDAICALSEIPFDVKSGAKPCFDKREAESLPLKREVEIEQILQNFTVASCCPAEVYSPLLIVAGDAFVSDMYEKMIVRGFASFPTVEIDARTLERQDLALSKENVFLRGLSETKSRHTLFIFKHCEELTGELIEQFEDILDYKCRKKFKLFNPPVSIDLSDIMIVMFASERTSEVKRISERSDTVSVSRISESEKADVTAAMLAERTQSYGLKGISVDDGCVAYLAKYDTKRILHILDGVLKRVVFTNAGAVTLELVKEMCDESDRTATRSGLGFTGGVITAGRRE